MKQEGLRFAILENGTFECDKSFLQMGNTATKDNRNPLATWVRAPVYSVLIEHPQEGYILYDGGACKGDEYGGGRRGAEQEKYMPFYTRPEDDIEARLASCNISLQDLSAVVISHAHWEHMGVLQRLQTLSRPPRIYVPKADYAYGLVETHRAKEDVFCTYLYQNFKFKNLAYTYVEREMEIAPGIEMLLFGGHAPAVIGLLLQGESGNYIFPSDAVMNRANRREMVRHSSMIYDTKRFLEDVERIDMLEKTYHAQVIYPHDMEQFQQLKKAPYFY